MAGKYKKLEGLTIKCVEEMYFSSCLQCVGMFVVYSKLKLTHVMLDMSMNVYKNLIPGLKKFTLALEQFFMCMFVPVHVV